jgi:hypothetical protein
VGIEKGFASSLENLEFSTSPTGQLISCTKMKKKVSAVA